MVLLCIFTHCYPRRASFDNLNADEIFNEIQKGIDSFANEKTYTAKEVDQILKKEFGV